MQSLHEEFEIYRNTVIHEHEDVEERIKEAFMIGAMVGAQLQFPQVMNEFNEYLTQIRNKDILRN